MAGVQGRHDAAAHYLVLDLAAAASVPPRSLSLDAAVDATATVRRHEAVTGTRSGQLTVWDLVGGGASRRLGAGGGHGGPVTGVAVSVDRRLLASTSVDRTVKLWNLDAEQLMHTLHGHADEVRAVVCQGHCQPRVVHGLG